MYVTCGIKLINSLYFLQLLEEEADHLTELQLEIEMQLERDNKKPRKAKRTGKSRNI